MKERKVFLQKQANSTAKNDEERKRAEEMNEQDKNRQDKNAQEENAQEENAPDEQYELDFDTDVNNPSKTTPGNETVTPFDAQVNQATQKEWDVSGITRGANDPLLNCLIMMTHIHHRPCSAETLTAGLPIDKNILTPQLFERAANRADFSSELVKRELHKINELVLPAILLLKNEQACVLLELTKNNSAIVLFPDNSQTKEEVSLEKLNQNYMGYAFFVRPNFRFTARSEVLKEEKPRHWFWSAMIEAIPTYAEVLVASSLINLFAIAVPLFTMNVYDRVVPNQSIDTLWVLAIGIGIVFFFDFVMRTMRAYFIDMASKNIDQKLSSRIFEQVLGVRMPERPKSVGAFTNTVQSYESFRDFITSSTLTIIVDLPFTIIFIIIISMIGGNLCLIPMILIPLIILVGFILHFPLSRLTKLSYKHSAEKHATLIESLSCAETIKSTGAESPMQRRWENIIALSARLGIKLRMLSGAGTHLAMLLQQLSTVLVVIMGVYKIAEGEMTTGALIACTILTGRALAPMSQVASLLTRYHQAKESLDSLNNVMQLEADRSEGRSPLNRPEWKGNFEFKNVTFAYPGESNPILNKINLKIKAGEKIAIIGRIGSGKTTLAKLLLGLYQINDGSILVDSTEIQQLDPAQLRHNIAYVPQDVTLFFGSIKENIMLSAPYVDDAEILRVAKISGVEAFVKNHPSGYDMQVGERGCNLSGGQRQAISIARALLEEPSVLIFDEPTNSMDDNTESVFRRTLNNYLTDQTMIVVTHKRSMLNLVDRIIVMDNGKIIADGPKETVLTALGAGKKSNKKI